MNNRASHLSPEKIVNRGSFYTPAKYVRLAAQWLCRCGLDRSYVILDSSCGYGAFFGLHEFFPENRFIGNDIDPVAAQTAKENYPFVEMHNFNALVKVSRRMFGAEREKLCAVGNPPYNDVTSMVGREIKKGVFEADVDIRSRDLGLSFLNSYAKLRVDFALILHPLSYLIKRQNYLAVRRFFAEYRIRESLVFSSFEFDGTSRKRGFPIVMALYQRSPNRGLRYEDVRRHVFTTAEGTKFSLDGFDYVTEHVRKYPGHKRFVPEILFYTLRDVNALRRSRTFIPKRSPGAVDVDPALLAYYCYIDLFKEYAEIPYWMGNFDIPYVKSEFDRYAGDIVALSRARHPEVFGPSAAPSPEVLRRVRGYISRSVIPRPRDP